MYDWKKCLRQFSAFLKDSSKRDTLESSLLERTDLDNNQLQNILPSLIKAHLDAYALMESDGRLRLASYIEALLNTLSKNGEEMQSRLSSMDSDFKLEALNEALFKFLIPFSAQDVTESSRDLDALSNLHERLTNETTDKNAMCRGLGICIIGIVSCVLFKVSLPVLIQSVALLSIGLPTVAATFGLAVALVGLLCMAKLAYDEVKKITFAYEIGQLNLSSGRAHREVLISSQALGSYNRFFATPKNQLTQDEKKGLDVTSSTPGHMTNPVG